MKLQLVPARTGFTWVKLGMKTFLRQPLAMAGLFFMFMAVVSLLSVVPVIGTAISLALVPAATVGLMAASREAMEDLKRILSGRSAFYSKADLHFNTSGMGVEDAFDGLRTQVREVLGIL